MEFTAGEFVRITEGTYKDCFGKVGNTVRADEDRSVNVLLDYASSFAFRKDQLEKIKIQTLSQAGITVGSTVTIISNRCPRWSLSVCDYPGEHTVATISDNVFKFSIDTGNTYSIFCVKECWEPVKTFVERMTGCPPAFLPFLEYLEKEDNRKLCFETGTIAKDGSVVLREFAKTWRIYRNGLIYNFSKEVKDILAKYRDDLLKASRVNPGTMVPTITEFTPVYEKYAREKGKEAIGPIKEEVQKLKEQSKEAEKEIKELSDYIEDAKLSLSSLNTIEERRRSKLIKAAIENLPASIRENTGRLTETNGHNKGYLAQIKKLVEELEAKEKMEVVGTQDQYDKLKQLCRDKIIDRFEIEDGRFFIDTMPLMIKKVNKRCPQTGEPDCDCCVGTQRYLYLGRVRISIHDSSCKVKPCGYFGMLPLSMGTNDFITPHIRGPITGNTPVSLAGCGNRCTGNYIDSFKKLAEKGEIAGLFLTIRQFLTTYNAHSPLTGWDNCSHLLIKDKTVPKHLNKDGRFNYEYLMETFGK